MTAVNHVSPETSPIRLRYTHDRWMVELGLPIYTGYYIEDMRTFQRETLPLLRQAGLR